MVFRRTISLGLALMLASLAYSATDVTNIDEEATHEQTNLIQVAQGTGDAMKINAFSLNGEGHILAACGSGPGEIRIMTDSGKLVRSWEIAVKPEAINSAPDGTVLVGGEGKLFRFDSNGEMIAEVDAPHAESLRNNTEVIRQEAITQLNRSRNANTSIGLADRVKMYEGIIKQLEDKAEGDELSEQEKLMLKALPRSLELFKKQLAEKKAEEEVEAKEAEEAASDDDDEGGKAKRKPKKKSGPSAEVIQSQVDRMMKSKMRVASISTDGDSVYVATGALKGYGFAIWKMSAEMTNGEEIVTGLSGCCGQMDVQACENGLFVAENSRKRVVRYDNAGKEICKWGKSDRTGMDGFTSCCNPMNVCFNGKGEVFTAESNTGRIKRFSPDGEFLAFVGDVKLVPGCKNVSIAVTPDHEKVYMLDLTRNHIVVMEKKPEPIERLAMELADMKTELASVKAELEIVKSTLAKREKQANAKSRKKARDTSTTAKSDI